MTVLVGVRCKDGVVIGSDSAKTSGVVPGQPTTTTTGKKIDIVEGQVIVAHTGQVGMGQRFSDIISKNWRSGAFKGKDQLETVCGMSALARSDFASTQADRGQYGSLVGFRGSKDGATLCEFALSDFQPELKTDIWYCSMGAGQLVVDPLLALFRKAFWGDKHPSLSGGILATCWALELAIELCPVGVRGPIKIAICDKAGARFIDDTELDGHRESAQEAITHFGEYKNKLESSDSSPDVPVPS